MLLNLSQPIMVWVARGPRYNVCMVLVANMYCEFYNLINIIDYYGLIGHHTQIVLVKSAMPIQDWIIGVVTSK